MSAETTVTALVLKRQDSGESDRRITILTPELGKIDAIARGARKSASRLASITEPLSQARLSLATGRARSYITQAEPIKPFKGLREDYSKLLAAISYAELAAAVLPWHQPDEPTYGLVLGGLTAIALHSDATIAAIWAQLQLMRHAGFLPSFEFCVVTGLRVQETFGFISPSSGGYLVASEAARHTDRYQVRAEVLIGLARMADLEIPPTRLKWADECLVALLPIWKSITDSAIPATTGFIDTIRLDIARHNE